MTSGKPRLQSIDVSLPPIHFNHSIVSNTTAAPKSSSQDLDSKSFPEPLKQSDLTQILEAAKKIRDEKIACLDKLHRAKKSPRKVAAGSRFANFTSPRSSLTNYKNKCAAPQQTVGFHPDSNTTKIEPTAEVIDLESVEAAMESRFDQPLESVSFVSLPNSIRSQKTRSQTNLTASPSKKEHSNSVKHPKGQRLRRSRSHARIGSHPFIKQSKMREGHKSISLEDVPNKVRSSSPALKREQRLLLERKSTTTSKPIVRRPGFVKQAVPKLNIKQANSVYGTRPYVVPMARRIGQQGSSPQRQGLAANKNARKRVPTNPYYPTRTKTKHQRQELAMPRGKSFHILSR